MQIPVKSKFIPQIPETLVYDFLQTNPESPLNEGNLKNSTWPPTHWRLESCRCRGCQHGQTRRRGCVGVAFLTSQAEPRPS